MRKPITAALAGLTTAGLMSASLANAALAEEIVVATAGPMTGQYASFGEQLRNGAELAIAEINAAGGVNGKMLKLTVGDDRCDKDEAVTTANRFIEEGAVFVAGHFCSNASIAAAAVYADKNIVQISPGSTNPKLTSERAGPGVYRVSGNDDQQGAVAGAYIAANFPDKNVAIIHDKSAYGAGLAEEARKALNAAGITETIFDAYSTDRKDYTALVAKLRQESIDVLYVGGYHTEAGLIVREMREQGLETQLISGDALITQQYWEIAGPAGQGTLATFVPDPRTFASARDAVATFREKGINPEGYTLHAYAAMKIWAEAANAAGSTELDAVTAKLNATTFETVLGPIAFDDRGDVTEPAYIWYVWDSGEYRAL